jgi:hypothetical protein
MTANTGEMVMHHATIKLVAMSCAIAIATFAIGCGKTETGTVEEVTDGKVTVADETSFAQTTYKIAPDTDIQKDGQPADLADIEPGDDVSVKSKSDAEGNRVATFVSVESNDAAGEGAAQPPSELPSDLAVKEGTVDDAELSPTVYEGHATAVQDGMLTLTDPAGTQLPFIVDDQTEITVDEQPAKLESIDNGAAVTVTARQEFDALIAVRVKASAAAEQPPAAAPETESPDNTGAEGPNSGTGPKL